MNILRALVTVALLSAAHCAWAGERIALVIGNERYERDVGALRNTDNDARAIAHTLETLGFHVIEKHNVTRDELLRAMAAFRATLVGAEVGVFYYAGHGISVGGSNYLIPIKAGFRPAGVDEVTLRMLAETRLFNAEQAVADMVSAGARCNLVILDACRTTKLPGGGRARGSGDGGLSEMTPPAGSLIAFATDAGRTAYDGDGKNGLYTEELLKNLATPGLTIEQVFKRTRAGVLKRSGGAQMPAEYSRLVGDDIYLAGPALVPVEKAEPVAPAAISEKTAEQWIDEAGKAADRGDAPSCISALEAAVAQKGLGDYAAAPLALLLDRVKEDLKVAKAPSSRIVSDLAICQAVESAVPRCLPAGQGSARELLARAASRRGDCLLLLEKPREALEAFQSAAALAPDDDYILYNRGCAYLALGDGTAAKRDFEKVARTESKHPGARKLAAEALAGMEAQ